MLYLQFCAGLPITITFVGEWLKRLIFHDDIKCNTAKDEDYTVYVRADYNCHVTIIHFM